MSEKRRELHKISYVEGELLRQGITQDGRSVNRLAAESGIPQPVLCRFVNGKRRLSRETANKLAETLNMNQEQTEAANWNAAEIADLDFIPADSQECNAAVRMALWEMFSKFERDFANMAAKMRLEADGLRHHLAMMEKDGFQEAADKLRHHLTKLEQDAKKMEQDAAQFRQHREEKLAPWMRAVHNKLDKARKEARAQGRTRRKTTSMN